MLIKDTIEKKILLLHWKQKMIFILKQFFVTTIFILKRMK